MKSDADKRECTTGQSKLASAHHVVADRRGKREYIVAILIRAQLAIGKVFSERDTAGLKYPEHLCWEYTSPVYSLQYTIQERGLANLALRREGHPYGISIIKYQRCLRFRAKCKAHV